MPLPPHRHQGRYDLLVWGAKGGGRVSIGAKQPRTQQHFSSPKPECPTDRTSMRTTPIQPATFTPNSWRASKFGIQQICRRQLSWTTLQTHLQRGWISVDFDRPDDHPTSLCDRSTTKDKCPGRPCVSTNVLNLRETDLSNPKPGHTTGGSKQSGARQGSGAGRGGAGRDTDGSVRPGDDTPSCPPGHRGQQS